jgi:hypothetical protein
MGSIIALVTALVVATVSGPARADTQATFTLPSGVEVRIVEAPFDRKLFRISGCTESGAACFINGRVPFGMDSGIPETYVKSISVRYKDRTYSLEASDTYNAWGGRPLEVKGVVRYFGARCSSAKYCHFRGLFSDAAGSFVAEWRIVDAVPIRTVLSNSDDIGALFRKHIDPPEYD